MNNYKYLFRGVGDRKIQFKTMKIMKTINTFLILFTGYTSLANNIMVSNVVINGQNTVTKTTQIQFDLSWENSWRTSTLESNWDAAWVFVKYRLKLSSNWHHVHLSNSGHVLPSGATLDIGLVNTSNAYNAVTNPAVGAFIYRNADGIGNVNFTNIQLRWDYGSQGLQDDDSVEICVYAIEMVYIPQGTFFVGDGNPPTSMSVGRFIEGGGSAPFEITSEDEITIGNSTGNLWGTSTTGNSTIGVAGTLPEEFPKGYAPFYIMKYELSQGMYKEYLNKLTRNQQNNRFVPSLVGRYLSSSTASTTPQARNGIKIIADPGAPEALILGNDLNNNNIAGEADDGEYIAVNWVSWVDAISFADWAGLRPFTELEYEKACRGSVNPIENEYVWRTNTVTLPTGITNIGLNNEIASPASANIVFGNTTGGPLRTGNFARTGTNRAESGGSYYGVMDLAGNLWEYAISVGITASSNNRLFEGAHHGDGVLDVNGSYNVPTWPNRAGARGGAWNETSSNITRAYISDRTNGSQANTTGRLNNYGIRLARTAP